jgi:hypothetical protein
MMLRIILFTVLLLFYSDAIVFATSTFFRCGPNLVSVGDTDQEVIRKCGEPTAKQVTGEKTTGYSRSTGNWESIDVTRRSDKKSPTTPYLEEYSEVSQKIEIWDYNCGNHSFTMTLVFVGHTLREIESGDYGTGDSDCIGAERRKEREAQINKQSQENKNRQRQENIERQMRNVKLQEEAYFHNEKNKSSIAERFKELNSLRDEGLISEEEYQMKRRSLLDGM